MTGLVCALALTTVLLQRLNGAFSGSSSSFVSERQSVGVRLSGTCDLPDTAVDRRRYIDSGGPWKEGGPTCGVERYLTYVSGTNGFSQLEVPVPLTTTNFPSQDRKWWVGVVLNLPIDDFMLLRWLWSGLAVKRVLMALTTTPCGFVWF